MYLSDKAIESTDDDDLDRLDFSKHLVDKIFSWKNEDCLVISLSGKWGSGKSTILNFVKEYINRENSKKFVEMQFCGFKVKRRKEETKSRDIICCGLNRKIEDSEELDGEITVIEFNPWYYSGEDNLTYHFYNELAKEIRIRGGTDSDKEISQTLMLYSSVLDVFSYGPSKFIKYFSLVFGAGLFLILSSTKNMSALYLIAIFLIIVGFSKELCDKVARIFEEKAKLEEKPLSSLKNDLKKKLSERKNKILVIIDDIDRLNNLEIKQIFQLVKVNTDFPNIIYLMAFDKEIIEKNLTDEKNISGREYLKKIVQVDFDIPAVKKSQIEKFLRREIISILSGLPVNYVDYFDRDYWIEVCSSGFLDHFENLRDVKRFANSLKFNISLMHKKNSMEVNLIDFISIEFIRVWYPELYYSIKVNKSLFTTVPSNYKAEDFEKESLAFKNVLSVVDKKNQKKIEKLLFALFPQCKYVCSKTNYTSDGIGWSRKLRICSKNHFDLYFVMIPGGGKDELTQYELDSFLYILHDTSQLQDCLKTYVEKSRIDKLLRRLIDYTEDFSRIPRESAINLIVALFNLYGNIPNEGIDSEDILFLDEFSWDSINENMIIVIIIKLIDREEKEDDRYEIVLESIQKSVNATGIVRYLVRQDYEDSKQLFSESHLEDLKKQCVVKLEQTITEDTLLSVYEPTLVIDCWKRWNKDPTRLNHILSEVIRSDDRLISFVELYLNYRASSKGTYINKNEPFAKNLNDLIDINAAYTRFESIKNSKCKEYESQKNVIDLFLDNYSPSKQESI